MSSERKIIHAADIHLDSPLQKLGSYENAPVERIRGASRRALENMVQFAIDEAVDLVVIAGDLYDGDWPDQNTGLFFVAQASRLVDAGIPLAVIRPWPKLVALVRSVTDTNNENRSRSPSHNLFWIQTTTKGIINYAEKDVSNIPTGTTRKKKSFGHTY